MLTEIVDHYDHIIRELCRPPVIIGHSLGGLVVQILLDRGLGAAGVAIDGAPAKGVRKLPLSMLKVGFPALRNPANRHKAVALTASSSTTRSPTHSMTSRPPRCTSATTSPVPTAPSTR
jgi:pimeloyl-ACP methyl ester carboxylesterase